MHRHSGPLSVSDNDAKQRSGPYIESEFVMHTVHNLPLPPPPYSLPPISSSLISLMVSVDVKHHVYLLMHIVTSIDQTRTYSILVLTVVYEHPHQYNPPPSQTVSRTG